MARGLAWFYVAANVATAAVCGAQIPDWRLLTVPFTLYIASITFAIMVLRRLAAHRVLLNSPGRLESFGRM